MHAGVKTAAEIRAEIERLKLFVIEYRMDKTRSIERAFAAAQIQALAWAVGESASPQHRVKID